MHNFVPSLEEDKSLAVNDSAIKEVA